MFKSHIFTVVLMALLIALNLNVAGENFCLASFAVGFCAYSLMSNLLACFIRSQIK